MGFLERRTLAKTVWRRLHDSLLATVFRQVQQARTTLLEKAEQESRRGTVCASCGVVKPDDWRRWHCAVCHRLVCEGCMLPYFDEHRDHQWLCADCPIPLDWIEE